MELFCRKQSTTRLAFSLSEGWDSGFEGFRHFLLSRYDVATADAAPLAMDQRRLVEFHFPAL